MLGKLNLLVLPLLSISLAFAQPDSGLQPVVRLNDLEPRAAAFEDASRDKPLVLNSAKEAEKYFAKKELARLASHVDFERQVLVLFAWRGSGGDRLEYAVQESFPEQVVFSFKPGLTKDLRQHVAAFALRSNVKWKLADPDRKPAADDGAEYVKVEIRGRLNSQVVAIGAETTGFAIAADGIRWELEFGRNAKLRHQAGELHEQTVIVTGRLNVRRGVETPQRWIVTVKSLHAAHDAADDRK